MRVTGGEHRGRILKVPSGGQVRPTQDRVREALFSMLMPYMADARFLDLFAGSGAVGLEALSRGASAVTWVERSRKVLGATRANVDAVGGLSHHVVCADAVAFLKRAIRSGHQYDIVFADPPYVRRRKDEDLVKVATLLRDGLLAPAGILVLEQAIEAEFELPEGWALMRERAYGQSVLRLLEIQRERGEQMGQVRKGC